MKRDIIEQERKKNHKKDEKKKRVYKKFNLTFFDLFLNPKNIYILKIIGLEGGEEDMIR